VLDPDPRAPAAQTASRHIEADFVDRQALDELSRLCRRITFEFENVPVASVEHLATLRPLYPGVRALQLTQDRLIEKNFINSLGLATAPFAEVTEAGEAVAALHRFGGQGILKTRRMGYDGKGQARVRSPADLRHALDEFAGKSAILEGFVDFACEISVVAARGVNGAFAAYDPAMNIHSGGILRRSVVPAPVDGEVLAAAVSAARAIADGLGHVGILAVEFFVAREGALLVNEIAPRVPHSGHWTEAVCPVSQFEQHIRAVAGLPLGQTLRIAGCELENLIGSDVERVPALLNEPDLMLHLYGKAEVREGRKMGHFTRVQRPGK
jgi:5-(carboxyamino)imidazole ribonucleotide synthase